MSPCPCGRPLLNHTSAGDTQTLKDRSTSVSVGSPGVHKVLFEPSEHLWWVWGLILNAILPLLPSCWGFFFALEPGLSFFGGIGYDLNQIPYDYTVVVTNRFKGLDLTECLKNHGQRFVTLYRRQWSRSSLRKRTVKRLSEEALQIGEKREAKDKGE